MDDMTLIELKVKRINLLKVVDRLHDRLGETITLTSNPYYDLRIANCKLAVLNNRIAKAESKKTPFWKNLFRK